MQHQRLVTLLETAIIAAFAMALEYLPHSAGISGLQFSYGLIPIAVLAYRRGLLPAVSAGLTWGLLDMVLRGFGDGGVLNPLQGIIEYPVAFAAAGLMGLVYPWMQRALKQHQTSKAVGIGIVGFAIGAGVKYLFHFLAGWIYWGSYAPKGWPAWQWSLFVNGGSAVMNLILGTVLLVLMIPIGRQLFVTQTAQKLTSAKNN
ncbi:energy-coupled thiamine transporter ThiT [Lacticaseibacillus saniviri]|uniref:Proton-coupled thiamine transporter n=1 Tax=Lacticaseibacillus saniviri JCM 17471 = DSM 24301 TaxID=1293598 RepID=A0A0R2N0U9_9LACO|nr:energy-coupled thiamine transporter ThiT [Lacticaseibacillus saniviri]KRO18386.1 hypothetical protein IV56_GL001519 [Lacticaseibacillus saniviri JCM 17471 = DSM 24301]MCG4282043.1 energy-coupled thiamine transporter ThiT [Lacticaseibacillus saniviri]